ncbi:S8 family serine peptidase [Niallia sp. 03133]|uniref:S8 family serine peptidase n=1 Tax=Niallia sp. 03133 TaxID=3458060 RepID=UPI004044C5BB
MKIRKRNAFIAAVLAIVLIISNMTMIKASAEVNTIETKAELTNGQVINEHFADGENIHWYKITPSITDFENFTHLQMTLRSHQEMDVSIYSSLENAESGSTFDPYYRYSYEDAPAVINFPLAWNNTYYIKVEYYPIEETVEEPTTKITGEEAGGEAIDTSYSLESAGVVLAPSTETAEECPVELSTEDKKDGQSILNDLRTIRDSILSQTENGKELSSLYYKAAPFLSAKMVWNKELRDNVLKDLRQLKPIFKELTTNGTSSTYTFTNADVEAINELYGYTIDAAPTFLKEQIKEKEAKVNITNLEDKTLSSVFTKLGASTSAVTNKNDENKYIVKLKSSRTLSSFKKNTKLLNIQGIEDLDHTDKIADNLFIVDLNNDVNTFSTKQKSSVLTSIQHASDVEFVEQIQEYKALNITKDVSNPYQWSLNNSGQSEGTVGADIQFANLHKLMQANKPAETLIAVVDTGVDNSLADLKENVRADLGKNYIANSTDASDDNGHGTHVSGIIAAGVDNNYSIAGIDSTAKILPVKVLDATGSGDTEQIAKGIKYAVDQGARVINLSLGGPYSRTLEYMLQYARSKNVTVIAASGNDGSGILSYPASSKYTTSVGASNDLDLVSDYSNYGEGLDLVAPGTNIPSLVPNGNVMYMSGTSMAAPHVSAVAGLLLSIDPSLKPSDVENLLAETTKDIAFTETDNTVPQDYTNQLSEDILEDPAIPEIKLEPGYDLVSGWGRLDAFGAVSALQLHANINTVYNSSKLIKGSALSGTEVSIVIGDKEYKGIADIKGNYKIEIPLQKTDSIFYASLKNTVNGAEAKTAIRITVKKDTTAPTAPKVYAVSDKDTKVTGKTEEFASVTVKANGKTIGKETSTIDGDFSVSIPKQKAGVKLSVTATDNAKNTSKTTTISVLDKTAPSAPSVSGSISDQTTKISGKTEAGSTVSINNGKKVIASGTSNSKGAYTLKVKKQKAGTKLEITSTDKSRNTSKVKEVTVLDKTAPSAPKVNSITTKTTAVKGSTEAYAAITIKVKGKTIASGKADKKGSFSIKIKKQKEKTLLSIYAKDKAGNTSKKTDKKVAKAK